MWMDKVTIAERKLADICIRCGVSKMHHRTYLDTPEATTVSREKLDICVDCYIKSLGINGKFFEKAIRDG